MVNDIDRESGLTLTAWLTGISPETEDDSDDAAGKNGGMLRVRFN